MDLVSSIVDLIIYPSCCWTKITQHVDLAIDFSVLAVFHYEMSSHLITRGNSWSLFFCFRSLTQSEIKKEEKKEKEKVILCILHFGTCNSCPGPACTVLLLDNLVGLSVLNKWLSRAFKPEIISVVHNLLAQFSFVPCASASWFCSFGTISSCNE